VDQLLQRRKRDEKHPVKTESRLLQRGRESYKNVDEEALALLRGLEYAAVQRNRGIDAILKEDLNGMPIPARVQRANETILEAANRLYKAARSKNAPVMFVIATQRGGYFEFEDQFPSNIVIVDAPGLSIVDALAQIKNECVVQDGGDTR
jgi:site-specific DNA-methyltransferase (adenine-specific)